MSFTTGASIGGSYNPMIKSPMQIPKLDRKSWQKVFINNIPDGLPDQLLSKIMNIFGVVKQIKRTVTTKGTLSHFAFVNYETVQQVVRAQRVLHQYRLLDNTLVVKSSDQTQMVLKQWLRMQSEQFKQRKEQGNAKEFADFEKFIRRDDKQYVVQLKKVIAEIQGQFKKISENRDKQQQKKEHPRQRQRQQRKKQQKRDLDKKYKQKYQNWMKREQDKYREYRRLKQKQHDHIRKKQKLIERELNLDSDQENRRIKKFRDHQRKRIMLKQFEEDMKALKKQEQEEQRNQKPPQPQQPFIQQQEAIPEPQQPKLIYQQTQYHSQKHQNNNQINMTVKNQVKEQLESQILPNAFSIVDDDQVKQPAVKRVNLALPKRKTQEERKKQDQQKLKKDKDMKEKLTKLMKKVPQDKQTLFGYKINWPAIAKNNILQRRIRPWLIKKSVEYIGQQNERFITLIQKKLVNNNTPEQILKKVKTVLDQQSQQFVIKLWKQLVFELIKLQNEIV